MSNSFLFHCPFCNQKLDCDSDIENTPVVCPSCNREIVPKRTDASGGIRIIVEEKSYKDEAETEGIKKCLFCSQTIKNDVIDCPYCGGKQKQTDPKDIMQKGLSAMQHWVKGKSVFGKREGIPDGESSSIMERVFRIWGMLNIAVAVVLLFLWLFSFRWSNGYGNGPMAETHSLALFLSMLSAVGGAVICYGVAELLHLFTRLVDDINVIKCKICNFKIDENQ